MTSNSSRLITVDSLRGLAALAVAVYHIDRVTLANSTSIANWMHQLFQFGFLGVPVFFVISGFVIAASTSKDAITFRYFGKFLVKRQTRLDPNYWASITLDILLGVLAIHFLAINTPLPSWESVAAHVLYLQDLLGFHQIAAIYWTLCLEIQFYVVFCLILALDTAYRKNRKMPQFNLKMWAFAAMTFYSLLIFSEIAPPPMRGLFISFWILFGMGAAAYHWGMNKRDNNWAFPFILISAIFSGFYHVKIKGSYNINLGFACAVAAFLFFGARYNKLGGLFTSPVLQYLGSRSYSIYLFHTIIGDRTGGVITQIVYPRLHLSPTEPLWAIVAFTITLAASLAIAEIAYRLIEIPSLRLSKRVRPDQPQSPFKDLMMTQPLRKAEYNVPQ